MTAFGSSEKADKAKGILEHAAVGLIIVLAAYAISRFVFSALEVGTTGGDSSPSANQTAGQPCGDKDNRVWDDEGTCVTKCAYEKGGECQQASFPCPGSYTASLCPGVTTIKCCSL